MVYKPTNKCIILKYKVIILPVKEKMWDGFGWKVRVNFHINK